MYVLGIETSCDETSAAVVKDGKIVLSNVISSSVKFHTRYGGVIPEIASRKQLEAVTFVTDTCLNEAKIKLNDVHLISVTKGPGLLGSLLVGISFAKAVSFSLGIPLLGIDHICAHIYSSLLCNDVRLPFTALVVSGGHTNLFYVTGFDKIELLGYTQDDACGEAFDKVAKILGLGYPGGPAIEKAAKNGDSRKIRFQCSGTKKPLNFSFSGIKTAVLYYVKKQSRVCGPYPPKTLASAPILVAETVDGRLISDIAASFQEAVVDTLIRKALLACNTRGVNRLVVGGGVAANNRLREKIYNRADEEKIKVYFPKKEFCMDNAAMIAGLGYQLYKKGYCSGLNLNADLSKI